MINILEILKNHPGIKAVYSPVTGTNIGIRKLKKDSESYPIHCGIFQLSKEGKLYINNMAECIIFPSKEMRDWRKINWKQGVILEGPKRNKVAFNAWSSKDFTTFIGIDTHGNYQEFATNAFDYVDSPYIKKDPNTKERKFEITIKEIESK